MATRRPLPILRDPPRKAEHPLRAIPAPATPVRSLYLHVPFCFHKCHYCDFYSIVDGREDRRPAFVDRLVEEIDAAEPWLTRPLETIFVGGGTPTLLPPELWRRLLDRLARLPRADSIEFTVEANPETVTDPLARALAAGGVNRVSLGAQSFDPTLLKQLERHHDPANVGRSIDLVRKAGISNVNLDLIFGIPTQSADDWARDLEKAIELEPDHLSAYGLMYETNTPLTEKLRQGRISRADEDLEAAMYETAIDRLERAGLAHYEISNWARPGREARHNLAYWRNENWLGLGPSASSHVAGIRWKNLPRLGSYLESRGFPPVTDVEALPEADRVGEALMLGFRLRAGFTHEALAAIVPPSDPRWGTIERFVRESLLERDERGIRLTRRGLLLADSVLSELI